MNEFQATDELKARAAQAELDVATRGLRNRQREFKQDPSDENQKNTVAAMDRYKTAVAFVASYNVQSNGAAQNGAAAPSVNGTNGTNPNGKGASKAATVSA
jgi:hypothetical protein